MAPGVTNHGRLLMAGTMTISEPATDPIPAPAADPDPLATDELLIEEVSIDGLCGVY
jgi:mycofactocin precursor